MYNIYFIANNGKFVYKNKTWNYLVTHWKKFVTHKCVETPHLRKHCRMYLRISRGF